MRVTQTGRSLLRSGERGRLQLFDLYDKACHPPYEAVTISTRQMGQNQSLVSKTKKLQDVAHFLILLRYEFGFYIKLTVTGFTTQQHYAVSSQFESLEHQSLMYPGQAAYPHNLYGSGVAVPCLSCRLDA